MSSILMTRNSRTRMTRNSSWRCLKLTNIVEYGLMSLQGPLLSIVKNMPNG